MCSKEWRKVSFKKLMKEGEIRENVILCPSCLENRIIIELDEDQLYCHECGWKSPAIEGVI